MSEELKTTEVEQPQKKDSRAFKTFLIIVLVLLILFSAFAAWMYFGKPSSLKDKFLTAVPYPLALVNGHPISAKDYFKRLQLAEKTLNGQPNVDMQQLSVQIYARLVDESKLSQLAAKNGVAVDGKELTDAYNQITQQYQQQNNAPFSNLLTSFDLSESDFKSEVLAPGVLSDDLVLWFNKQESLNQDQYNKIHNLQQQINQGASFESLVKDNTEDDSGKLTNGDLGFVDLSQTLPELQQQLTGAKKGDVRFVVSRYGLHLMKVADQDNGGQNGGVRLHLEQIFVKPADFQTWYDNATKNYAVTKLVKF